MLEQGELLTLDDNKKYAVVYNVNLNKKDYTFLIDQDDYSNTLICEYDGNNKLKEVTDEKVMKTLMRIFLIFKEENK